MASKYKTLPSLHCFGISAGSNQKYWYSENFFAVAFKTRFHTDGYLYVVTKADILTNRVNLI